MRKISLTLVLLFVGALVIIQFFRPEKNLGEVGPGDILMQDNVPENIKTILKTSCLDCHSNHTNYHWYHELAPASWFVNNHIVEGKKELNLSEWGEMDKMKKIGVLEDISEEVTKKKMPLKSYTFIHRDARLTKEQITELNQWTEQMSQSIITGN